MKYIIKKKCAPCWSFLRTLNINCSFQSKSLTTRNFMEQSTCQVIFRFVCKTQSSVKDCHWSLLRTISFHPFYSTSLIPISLLSMAWYSNWSFLRSCPPKRSMYFASLSHSCHKPRRSHLSCGYRPNIIW